MGRAVLPSSSPAEKCRIMQQRSRLEDDSEAQRHRGMTRHKEAESASLPPVHSLSATPPLALSLLLPLSVSAKSIRVVPAPRESHKN